MPGSELRKLACIVAGDRSRTASMSVAPIHLRPEADKFDHLVWILDEQGGQCHLTSYVNGVMRARGQASDGDLALHQRPGTPEIVVAPSASFGDTKLPWGGEIITLTVYDRPLKAEEVEKNRLAGPPKGTGYWGEPSSQSAGAAAR
jgi:hypothetical protein